MKDVCIVLFILISEICVMYEYSNIYDRTKEICKRQVQIETKIDQNADDIQQMKKEMVILDSVCQKVLNNEW